MDVATRKFDSVAPLVPQGRLPPSIVEGVPSDRKILWISGTKTKTAQRRVVVPTVLKPLFVRAISGLRPSETVFKLNRYGLRDMTRQICSIANVPLVGPQSMRGLHATLAVGGGAPAETVTKSLGHRSFETTKLAYAKSEALIAASVTEVGNQLGNSQVLLIPGSKDQPEKLA